MTKIVCIILSIYLVEIFIKRGGVGGGGSSNILRKMFAGISFFMVSSSNLKYKLIRHVTFNPLLS